MAIRPLERTRPGGISRVPYLPGLDGMRAFAVAAVMLYHAKFDFMPGGFLGVEVFFVISGYLITLLLIAEHERTQRIGLKAFWYRRAKRLLPALFVMLTLLVVYCALFKRSALGHLRGDTMAGIFYVSNWYQIWTGAGYTAQFDFAPLRHLWSLAVEEQFYLVCPVVMAGLLRFRGRRRLPELAPWLVGIAVAITVAVALLYSPDPNFGSCENDPTAYWNVAGRCVAKNDTLYLGTFSRAGGLLLGAAFAMLWRPIAILRGPLRNKSRMLDGLFLVGAAVVGLQMWRVHLLREDGSGDPWLFRGGFLVTGIATLLMIAAVTHADSLVARVLSTPVISWVGTRSYGLYLFHWPIYQIMRKEAGAELGWHRFLIAVPIALVITEASYRLVETPIRRGGFAALFSRRDGRRMTPQHRQQIMVGSAISALLLGFAGVSTAVAPLECDSPTNCSLEEGQQAIANQSSTTTTSLATTTTSTTAPPPVSTRPGETTAPTTSTTTPPTTVAPTTTTVAGGPGPIAIGDSVMLGAAQKLAMNGILVNAEVSRQAQQVLDTVRIMKSLSQIGHTLIIHMGTNGEVGPNTLAALMEELRPIPQVLMITARVDRGWTAANNAMLRALPAQFPNVSVLDWEVVGNECVDACYASDGIHLSKNGRIFYANKIAEAIGVPAVAAPD